MKTMNVPKFTAEDSLYRTTRCYQSVATQGYSSREQVVISQLRIDVFRKGPVGILGTFWCKTICEARLGACGAAHGDNRVGDTMPLFILV
jgi:hypothetical protein